MNIRRSGNVIMMNWFFIGTVLGIDLILGCAGIFMHGWLKIAFIAFFAFGVLAVIEALKTKLIMSSGRIEIREPWKTRVILKENIELVTWEKGGGAAFKLKSGKWEKIPNFGNPLSLCNILRAWLQKGG